MLHYNQQAEYQYRSEMWFFKLKFFYMLFIRFEMDINSCLDITNKMTIKKTIQQFNDYNVKSTCYGNMYKVEKNNQE